MAQGAVDTGRVRAAIGADVARSVRDVRRAPRPRPGAPRRAWRLLGAVPPRARVRGGVRHRHLLVGARPHVHLRRDRDAGARRGATDGDARSTRPHGDAPDGVTRLHTATGDRAGARDPRLRRRAHRCTARRGGGDLVRDLFKPLPSMVVAHYLGVPAEDRTQFDGWTEAIVAANALGDPLAATAALEDMMGYFAALAERRRHDPGDDTISISSRRAGTPSPPTWSRCWASRSRWSPAGTTRPPACSAVRPSC